MKTIDFYLSHDIYDNLKKDSAVHELSDVILPPLWRDETSCGDDHPEDLVIHGPIGKLMRNLFECGYTMGQEFVIFADNEPTINLWHLPWQHLKSATFGIAVRARVKSINAKRTFLGEVKEIDEEVFRKSINRYDTHDQRVLNHIATGGFWSEEQLHDIQRGSVVCRHCGSDEPSAIHTLWNCPVINKLENHHALQISLTAIA